jgi:Ca-activated chloride channel homolog
VTTNLSGLDQHPCFILIGLKVSRSKGIPNRQAIPMKTFYLLLVTLAFLFPAQLHAQSGRNRAIELPPKVGDKSTADPPRSDEGTSESKIIPGGETVEGDVIRVDTSLVTVPVSVVDRYGKYVPILRRENFKIFEDGVEQKIAYFATTDQPFTVVLLIDTSGSTQFRLEDIQEAAITFVDKLKPVDRVMVMSFDDRIDVLCKPTSDRELITKAIRRTRTGGGTRLYDAVDAIFTKQLKTISGRKAVVLFTDGVDTSSYRASYDSTIRLAEESDASIYSVDYDTSGTSSVFGQGLPLPGRRGTVLGIPLPGPGGTGIPGSSRGEYRRANAYLHALSDQTGGRFYSGDSSFGISQAFAWIAEELGRQYSLGYYPKKVGQDGQRRQIKVRASEPELIVKARDSYIYTEKRSPENQAIEKNEPADKKPYVSGSRTNISGSRTN